MQRREQRYQHLTGDPGVVFPFIKKEMNNWKSLKKKADDEAAWEKKLQGITRRVPEEIDRLKPFIRFIAEAVHPSRIYLLNSHTDAEEEEGAEQNTDVQQNTDVEWKADMKREMDVEWKADMKRKTDVKRETEKYYDLLVVTKGPEGVSLADLQPLFDMAYLSDSRVHCMLHDQGVVMEGLKNGHIFYSLHCRPENLIYDDETTVFPEPSRGAMAHIKQQAFKRFRDSMNVAKDFYMSAQFFNGDPSSPLVAFFLNQAVELTYRSVLNALNGCCKKTHEIQALQKQARRCAGRLNRILPADTPEGKRLTGLLDRAYIAARYDPDFRADLNDLAALLETTAVLQKAAEELVTSRLGPGGELTAHFGGNRQCPTVPFLNGGAYYA